MRNLTKNLQALFRLALMPASKSKQSPWGERRLDTPGLKGCWDGGWAAAGGPLVLSLPAREYPLPLKRSQHGLSGPLLFSIMVVVPVGQCMDLFVPQLNLFPFIRLRQLDLCSLIV